MGRSRGGLSTKIHALLDAAGRPIRLVLTAGQAGDAPVAADLLKDLAPGTTLLADRAYDTDAIRGFADTRGAWANIPPKVTRKDSLPSQTACSFEFNPPFVRPISRGNHSEVYSDHGKHANLVESYFSRLRRTVQGQHHHVSPQYLHQYANHAAWLEDNRRTGNGTLAHIMVSNAMGSPVSRDWKGYWQRAA